MLKSRYAILIATCAATALGTPVAQAHVQGNWSYAKAVKSTSSLTAKTQTSVRPDDRAGSRGI